ncbi:hypothetical protein ACFLVY_00620 [Chloroflexota bacterium]
MKKKVGIIVGITLTVVMVLALVPGVALAGIGSDIPDNGKHYNLNIIGVPHNKTAPDMTGSNRHTLFVPVNSRGSVSRQVTIEFMRNPDNPNEFRVADGNATDDDYALIYCPYEDYGTLSFNVYAIALGKPNGQAAEVVASVTFSGGTTGTLDMGSFTLKREKVDGKGKPKVVDISDIFRASGIIMFGDGSTQSFSNVWVFNIPDLLQYLWGYDAKGLRHMQVRFYETTSGSYGPIIPPP